MPRLIFVSRTLTEVAFMALLVAVYSCLAVWKEHTSLHDVADIPPELHTTLSLVLGLLLVFRTNAAYQRWWEARTLWGALVNASRNYAAKLVTLTRAGRPDIEQAGRVLVAFPPALRDHLRGEEIKGLPTELHSVLQAKHTPSALVKLLYTQLGVWKASGVIDGDELRVLDRELAKLLDICGGCERILNTRIARSYRRFARQCVALFLLTLPWSVVDSFGWWAVPLTGIVAYFMIGLEVVAEHVEEPFGYDEDDLNLDGLCQTIERSVSELIATP